MQTSNPNKDIEVPQAPLDSISSLCWSPTPDNFLVTGSWDNEVRVWQVRQNLNSYAAEPKASTTGEAPVLAVTLTKDGRIFSSSCDGTAKCWPISQSGQQPYIVAKHDSGIKSVHWIEEMNLLCTGSWDKTLKYWDTRQQNPAASITLPDKIYALDVTFPLATVACADRQIVVFNLNNPGVEYKRIVSPLKYQIRCVANFPDKAGFAVGSIEGRVGIQYVEETNQSKNFAFKCHRDGNDIFAVNSLAFHPRYGTFSTAGADGTYNYWDKDSKQRLRAFHKCSAPITAASFNYDGNFFAYAVSYDWSKGLENYNPKQQNHIFIHTVTDNEIKNRAK